MTADFNRVSAGMEIAFRLIRSGMDIYNTVKGKPDLSDDDIRALIVRENLEQQEARAQLLALIEKSEGDKQ